MPAPSGELARCAAAGRGTCGCGSILSSTTRRGASQAGDLAAIGANARRAVEDSTTVAYIGEPEPAATRSPGRSWKQRRSPRSLISGAAAMSEILEAIEARRRRRSPSLRQLGRRSSTSSLWRWEGEPSARVPRAGPRSAASRSGMLELVAEVQRPPRHHPLPASSTAPNSLPNLRSRTKPGTGITAGRPSARPSAFEKSRFVTGFGAVALTTPLTFVVVERPEQDPDLVLDVDPGDVLVAAGQRPADAELERRQQLAQQAAVGVEDVAGADDHQPHAVRLDLARPPSPTPGRPRSRSPRRRRRPTRRRSRRRGRRSSRPPTG